MGFDPRPRTLCSRSCARQTWALGGRPCKQARQRMCTPAIARAFDEFCKRAPASSRRQAGEQASADKQTRVSTSGCKRVWTRARACTQSCAGFLIRVRSSAHKRANGSAPEFARKQARKCATRVRARQALGLALMLSLPLVLALALALELSRVRRRAESGAFVSLCCLCACLLACLFVCAHMRALALTSVSDCLNLRPFALALALALVRAHARRAKPH